MTLPSRNLCMRIRPAVVSKMMRPRVKLSKCAVVFFHTGGILREKQESRFTGNPHFSAFTLDRQTKSRWKVAWLYMMKRKAELEGEEELPRSDQLNWNYSAEVNALAHRLKIRVHADVIKTAFTEPYTATDNASELSTNNNDLYRAGYKFTIAFLELYLKKAFPRMGRNCAESVVRYLVSEELLSYVAGNLGYRDLVQSVEFPITPSALSRSFLASVAAIMVGPGGKTEAARFVYDFIVTNLIDKDIVHDIWKPKDPMHYLVRELETLNLPPPEVRLTKRSGATTVTPIFFVGLFCDGKLWTESGGESIIKAETDAAKLALKRLYDVDVDRYFPLVDPFSDSDVMEKLENVDVDLPTRNSERIEDSSSPASMEKTRFSIFK